MNITDSVRGRLIVSCQAGELSPFRDPDAMRIMTRAVVAGGACALRLESVAHVEAIAPEGTPVIGLVKRRHPGSPVYITPTAEDVAALARAGATVVALDGTPRDRPNGEVLRDLIALGHDLGVTMMADVDSVAAAEYALGLGADWVGTTLAGYTGVSTGPGPDIALVAQLAAVSSAPVIAEGRYSRPEQLAAALEVGAWSVVVGTAITDPFRLTQSFVRASTEFAEDRK